MQLRYLKEVELKKSTPIKQSNGTYIESLATIDTYQIQKQELSDEISASIYGADLNKTARIKSVNSELEAYLKPKLSNESDNISKYFIIMDNMRYKIIAVYEKWIDIQAIIYEEPSI